MPLLFFIDCEVIYKKLEFQTVFGTKPLDKTSPAERDGPRLLIPVVPPKVMQGQFTIHLHSKNSCFQPVSALDTPPPKIIVYGTSSKRLDDSRNI